ncbi:MAG: SufD family Fe-S cluster assembly protein [Bacilli bacterium]|nr:SufD family Fe-S cluster assembly protein [Bacilli bacterium]
MNKIFVRRDKIISNSDNIEIIENKIRFLNNGKYLVEYSDIDDINLEYYVSNEISVTLFESCFLENIKVNNKYVINNGNLVVNKFYNVNNVLEKIDIDLCHDNDKLDYKFSNICKNNEEYLININHMAKSTNSNICNKSIALDGSKLNFVINSNVGREYEKSILNQNTRIVTFGNSDSKISPNMYIDCDDIEARHGSVIGTFKDDLVFYLMSRGISYKDSVKLLVKGYLFSNINADNDLREKILNVIDMYWR